MARDFNGSSDRLEADTAALTVEPLTFACWFNTDSNTVEEILMYIGDKDSADLNYWALLLKGDTAGDPVRAKAASGSASSAASTSTGFSTATWQHACAVFASATDRRAFINGGSKGTNATSRTPGATPDRTSIGRYGDSTPSNYYDGRIAEAAIWNVALTDNEVQMLAQGVSPLFVRTASLVSYWPIGRGSPENSFGGDVLALTVTGAVVYDHAPVSPMFGFNRFVLPSAAGGGPTTYPQSVAGTLTSSGALAKQTAKLPAGTLTSSGALVKQTQIAKSGILTSSATLIKQAQKDLAGILSSSGTLTASKTVLLSLVGTLTSSGTLVKQTGRSLTGILTSIGNLITELIGAPPYVAPPPGPKKVPRIQRFNVRRTRKRSKR